MKLQLRELILLTLMLALLGCSWWFGFKRVAERKEQYRADEADKRRELIDLQMATADIDDLERHVDELRQAVEFFESKLPREENVQGTLTDVWQAAQKNGLSIKEFKPGNVRRDSHYSEKPISLQLSGDFEGFYAYQLELERMDRITRVPMLKLSRIDDQDGQTQAEMTLCIFFEPAGTAGEVISG